MSRARKITKVYVENVRGIGQKSFDLEILPNKPTLIVAPNGTGKTSLARAFGSLQSTRIALNKDDYYQGNDQNSPRLELTYEDEAGSLVVKAADSASNQIGSEFDVYTIGGQLVPKASKRKISGNVVATASIEVQPVVLIPKVPKKTPFSYDYSLVKSALGVSGKAFPNISAILANKCLMLRIQKEVDLSRALLATPHKAVTAFAEAVKTATGTAQQILDAIPEDMTAELEAVPHIAAIVGILKDENVTLPYSGSYIAAAVQIHNLYRSDKSAFRSAIESYQYLVEKGEIERDLASLRLTWKNIRPKEDLKRGLIIEFPPANQISNGERDTLWFVASLLRGWRLLKSDKCVIVIDEVFDYLDEANLIACQYHLTQMIRQNKSEGRQVFILIMTHLNPSCFRGFAFRDQKIQYLTSRPGGLPRDVEKVLLKRENLSISDDLSRYFLHFNQNQKDLTAAFASLGLPSNLNTSAKFKAHVNDQLRRYRDHKSYEPVAVCCALRNRIEELAYDQLTPAAQPGFVTVHKTAEKLDYAITNGADVPEVSYLLALIYNDAAHIREHADNDTPLRSKLENLSIRSMIEAAT
ncbi:ATP-binding protein [Sphingomonas prati]|uniref:Energy-coupling factor transporter ATP-binding protein EcfA2 n=1 Tax=Sphingomonas prati TaxID=1843237 RepID=A0A7W9F2Y5_9SPHN|nr:ATP-binding protein [Sphingomonas prati]MBB5730922.1 energy-coupling factor transporter ATP-binding protein EcfA2 [Sphingomonas prati]GGE97952.1 hypothetical protein GCM10011404_33890 [Sphingomonas prati]